MLDDRILEHLRRAGPSTAAEIAAALDADLGDVRLRLGALLGAEAGVWGGRWHLLELSAAARLANLERSTRALGDGLVKGTGGGRE